MKLGRILRLSALILVACWLVACPNPAGSGQSGTTFWTMRFDTNPDGDYYQVGASLLASGTHVLIYQETGGPVSAAQAQAIAAEFDTHIYGLIRSNFGPESDVDNNGKIILLLQDIKDGYNGTTKTSYIGGFYSLGNEISQQYFAQSNQNDMIYLDTYPNQPGTSSFYASIAHEFQHLVNFNVTVIESTNQNIVLPDTWLNEGLSTAAEALYLGQQNADRIAYYNQDSQHSIAKGQNFINWSPAAYDDPVASYSTVYLFFQWLAIQSSNNSGIYKDIINSGYPDYRAIESAAQARIYQNVATPWKTIFSDWLIANVFNQATGIHGYRGNITSLTPPAISDLPGYQLNYQGQIKSLSQGEAILVKSNPSSTWSLSQPVPSQISYYGLDTGSYAIDANAADGVTGNRFLVVENDTAQNTSCTTNPLPSVGQATVPVSGSARALAPRAASLGPGAYMIDGPLGKLPDLPPGAIKWPTK